MSRRDIEQAVALERQGRVDESMAIYQTILRQQPYNADVLSLLGQAFARRGDTRNPISCLQQARGLLPADVSAAFNLGVAFLAENARDKALGCFADALSIDPGFLPACAAFERAAALAPGDVQTLVYGWLKTLDHSRFEALVPVTTAKPDSRNPCVIAFGPARRTWLDGCGGLPATSPTACCTPKSAWRA